MPVCVVSGGMGGPKLQIPNSRFPVLLREGIKLALLVEQ